MTLASVGASAQETHFLYGDRFIEARKSATLDAASGGGASIGTGGHLTIGAFDTVYVSTDTDDTQQGEFEPGTSNRVWAHGNGDLQVDALITGDADFGGTATLDASASITGTTQENQTGLPSIFIPRRDVVAGTTDVYVSGGPQTLAAGTSYGQIIVGFGETLTLSGGVYHATQIWVEPGATIVVDAATQLMLEKRFVFSSNSAVTLGTGLAPADFEVFVHSNVGPESCSTCTVGTRVDSWLDYSVDFKGVIYSPTGDVVVRGWASVEGVIWAGSISIDRSATLTYSPANAISDVDGDGYTIAQGDCDDEDPTRYPGATEVCDGVDQDCDATVDEGALVTFYADADSDTYGDSGSTTAACTVPAGYVGNQLDCDDGSAASFPGATEVCEDGIDQNCNGYDRSCDERFFLYGDRFVDIRKSAAATGGLEGGSIGTGGLLTIGPFSTVEVSTGLNDPAQGSLAPGLLSRVFGGGNATLGVDALIDGDADFAGIATLDASATVTGALQQSQTGLPQILIPTWDTAATGSDLFVAGGTTQVVPPGDYGFLSVGGNGRMVLSGGLYTVGTFIVYADGIVEVSSTTQMTVESRALFFDRASTDHSAGMAARDFELYINSGVAPETCPACDVWSRSDTRLMDDTSIEAIIYAPSADVVIGEDASFTGTIQAGSISVDQRATLTYSPPYIDDTDNDGDSWAIGEGDCDDTTAAINPGALEVCDGVDNDCDGQIDEGLLTTYYRDFDGDGDGDASTTIAACSVPSGYVANADDCDDADATAFIGAAETCDDGIDQDCSGYDLSCSDEDADQDGFTVNTGDCDDSDADINPYATEICNGEDDNCDATTDEGLLLPVYVDADGDGFGDLSPSLVCSVPIGYSLLPGDCDDTNGLAFPGALEICDDSIDQSCSGSDLDCTDADEDKDGVTAAEGDCDDLDASIGPFAADVCEDTVDQDCDGYDAPCAVGTLEPTQIDGTVTTSLVDSCFLFDGADPVQPGLQTGLVEELRLAVIHGSVRDERGRILEGVSVALKAEPAYGTTTTRADGEFDLAVNGGRSHIVQLSRPGFLPIERNVEVGVRAFSKHLNVVMQRESLVATVVDLDVPLVSQVVAAAERTDALGARQPLLLFPDGVVGTPVVCSGCQAADPLDAATIRVTEYTAGTAVHDSVPAELPANNAPIFGFEVGVDEASLGLHLSEDVPLYVRNLVELPVGEEAYVGSYDWDASAWAAEPNATVVEVLTNDSSTVTLDVDGSQTAATSGQLAALGITSSELTTLAGLSDVGDELIRVPLSHFSTFVVSLPAGQRGLGPRPDVADTDPSPECDESVAVSTASIPLDDAVFDLVWENRNVAGARGELTIDVPLTSGSIASGLQRVDVIVEVAGKTYRDSYAASPDLTFRAQWDGKDRFEREVQGSQAYTVRVGYSYGAGYQEAAAGGAFGDGGSGVTLASRDVRGGATEWTVRTKTLDGLGRVAQEDSLRLGGWRPEGYAIYNPDTRVMTGGLGGRVDPSSAGRVIETVAGTGTAGTSGDSGAATSANLDNPVDVAVAADGTLYIADQDAHRVRAVAPDGTISTFAGDGTPATWTSGSTSGDGGQATSAQLNEPTAVAVGPDGSVYIGESGYGAQIGDEGRLRRVAPDGVITTVAGIPEAGPNDCPGISGDGGLAISAPIEQVKSVSVTAAGDVFVATGLHNVRRIDRGGIITTVAGEWCTNGYPLAEGDPAAQPWRADHHAVLPSGELLLTDPADHIITYVDRSGLVGVFAGDPDPQTQVDADGIAATTADLDYPKGLAVLADGSVLVSEWLSAGAGTVRIITPDGLIDTLAGGGTGLGDGGDPADGQLDDPMGLAVGPDGTVYVADSGHHRVRAIRQVLPGPSTSDVTVDDGDFRYTFDADGRHLKTTQLSTSTDVATYAYDGDGLLASVTDASSVVTTIARDLDGLATSISTASTGQMATLEVDEKALRRLIASGGSTWEVLAIDGLVSLIDRDEDRQAEFDYTERNCPEPAEIVSFTAQPDNLPTAGGLASTLTWDTEGASYCRFGEQGTTLEDVKPDDFRTVAPSATTAYVLECAGPEGQVSDTVVVTVSGTKLPMSASLSEMEIVSDSDVPADGHTVAGVLVTVLDTAGAPVPGQRVSLTISGLPQATLPDPTFTTSIGTAFLPVTSTASGTATIGAVVNEGIPGAELVLSATDSITFVDAEHVLGVGWYDFTALPISGAVIVFPEDVDLGNPFCGADDVDYAQFDSLMDVYDQATFFVGELTVASQPTLVRTPLVYGGPFRPSDVPPGMPGFGADTHSLTPSVAPQMLQTGAIYISNLSYSTDSFSWGGDCEGTAPDVDLPCRPGGGGLNPPPCTDPDVSCPSLDSEVTLEIGGIDVACTNIRDLTGDCLPESAAPAPTGDRVPFDLARGCFAAPGRSDGVLGHHPDPYGLCETFMGGPHCQGCSGDWWDGPCGVLGDGVNIVDAECLTASGATADFDPTSDSSCTDVEQAITPEIGADFGIQFLERYLACKANPSNCGEVSLCPASSAASGDCDGIEMGGNWIQCQGAEPGADYFCDSTQRLLCGPIAAGGCLPIGDPLSWYEPDDSVGAFFRAMVRKGAGVGPRSQQAADKAETDTNEGNEGDGGGEAKDDAAKPDAEDGDPVDLGSGEFSFVSTDVSFPSRGVPFMMERAYRSGGSRSGTMGPGFVHSFEEYIELVGDRYNRHNVPDYCVAGLPTVLCLLRYDATGGQQLYIYDYKRGVYASDVGGFSTIRVHSEGFILFESGGRRRHYNLLGRLTRMEDAMGFGVNITYTRRTDGEVACDGTPFRYVGSPFDSIIEEYGVAFPGIGRVDKVDGVSARNLEFARYEIDKVVDSYGREFTFNHETYSQGGTGSTCDTVTPPTDFSDVPRARRRLASISHRGETLIDYSYAWLDATEEAYLTKVERHGLAGPDDAPIDARLTLQQQPLVSRYDWQWEGLLTPNGPLAWTVIPGTSSGGGEAGEQIDYGDQHENEEFERNGIHSRAFWSDVLRLEGDVQACGLSLATSPGVQAVGDPCEQRAIEHGGHDLVGQQVPRPQMMLSIAEAIADNIVRVYTGDEDENAPLIGNDAYPDVESFYEFDPRSIDFDRVTKQRFGALPRVEPASVADEEERPIGAAGSVSVFSWKSRYAQLTMRQALSGRPNIQEPPEPGTLTVSQQLDGQGLQLVADGSLVADPDDVIAEFGWFRRETPDDTRGLWFEDGVALPAEVLAAAPAETVGDPEWDLRESGRCDNLDSFTEFPTFFVRRPAGPRNDEETTSLPTVDDVVLSELTCAAISARQAKDAFRNEAVTYCDEDSGTPFPDCEEEDRLGQRRFTLAWDLARVCRWVEVEARDGATSYYGMNFRGQPLVEAHPSPLENGSFSISKRVFNADGMMIEEERPDLSRTSIVYDGEVTGDAGDWEGATTVLRRGNALVVTDDSSSSGMPAHLAMAETFDPLTGTTTTVAGQSRTWTFSYEPVYQQLQRVIRPDGSEEEFYYDYQQLSAPQFNEEIPYPARLSAPGAIGLGAHLWLSGLVYRTLPVFVLEGEIAPPGLGQGDLDGDGAVDGSERSPGLVVHRVHSGGSTPAEEYASRTERSDSGRLVATTATADWEIPSSDTDRVEYYYYDDLADSESGAFDITDCNGDCGPLALVRTLRTVGDSSPVNVLDRFFVYDALGLVRLSRQNVDTVAEIGDSATEVVTQRDDLGRVLTVTDAEGAESTHVYNGRGELVETTVVDVSQGGLPAAPTLRTTYAWAMSDISLGSCTEVGSGACGAFQSAAWGEALALRDGEAGLGLNAIYSVATFDEEDRATATVDAEGGRVDVVYGDSGVLLGRTIRVDGGANDLEMSLTYDESGRLLSAENGTGSDVLRTNFQYDRWGRQIGEHRNDLLSVGFSTSSGTVSRARYDLLDRVVGTWVEGDVDDSGTARLVLSLQTQELNVAGLPDRVHRYASATLTDSPAMAGAVNDESVGGDDWATDFYIYDHAYRVESHQPEGLPATTSLYDGFGPYQIDTPTHLQVIDRRPRDREVEVTVTNKAEGQHVVATQARYLTEFDGAGRTVLRTRSDLDIESSPGTPVELTTEYLRDGLGRLRETLLESGRSTQVIFDRAGRPEVSYERSRSGVVTRTTNYTYDRAQRLEAEENVEGNQTILRTYDLAGRVVQKDVVGTVIANNTTRTEEYFFDTAGRFRRMERNRINSGVKRCLLYGYEENRVAPASLTFGDCGAESIAKEWGRDGLDRPVVATDHNLVELDPNSRLGNRRVLENELTYDALGRLIAETTAELGGSALLIGTQSHVYDATYLGKSEEVLPSGGRFEFNYAQSGLPTTMTRFSASAGALDGVPTAFQYVGGLWSRALSGDGDPQLGWHSHLQTKERNAFGWVTSSGLFDDASNILRREDVLHGPDARIIASRREGAISGVSAKGYRYDELRRLKSHSFQQISPLSLAAFEALRDEALGDEENLTEHSIVVSDGPLAEVTHTPNDGISTVSADEWGREFSAGYDATVGGAPPATVNDRSVTRDDDHRLGDDGSLEYIFDAMDRLVGVYRPDGDYQELELHYDGLGRRRIEARLRGDNPYLEEVILNYQGGNVVEETALSDPAEVQYATTHGPALDAPLLYSACEMNPNTLETQNDSFEPCAIWAIGTDVRGDAVASVAYRDDTIASEATLGPWGERTLHGGGACVGGLEDGSASLPSGATCAGIAVGRFGIAGARQHARTKLVDLRNRVYATHLKSFVSADPMGNVDSFGQFNYVAGDPINFRDPWGLESTGADGDGPVTVAAKVVANVAIAVVNAGIDVYNAVASGACVGGCGRPSVLPRIDRFDYFQINTGSGSGDGLTPEGRRLADALDLGVDVEASPRAVSLINQAAEDGVKVKRMDDDRMGVRGVKAAGKYDPETNTLKLRDRNGGPTFARLATIFHELTHPHQYLGKPTPREMVRRGVSKENFVRILMRREVPAEVNGRSMARELADLNELPLGGTEKQREVIELQHETGGLAPEQLKEVVTKEMWHGPPMLGRTAFPFGWAYERGYGLEYDRLSQEQEQE